MVTEYHNNGLVKEKDSCYVLQIKNLVRSTLTNLLLTFKKVNIANYLCIRLVTIELLWIKLD